MKYLSVPSLIMKMHRWSCLSENRNQFQYYCHSNKTLSIESFIVTVSLQADGHDHGLEQVSEDQTSLRIPLLGLKERKKERNQQGQLCEMEYFLLLCTCVGRENIFFLLVEAIFTGS